MRRTLALIVPLLLAGALPALAGWEEGVAAFKAKNYQQAVGEFQKVVEQAPDSYSGEYMLGLSLEQLGRKEEALHHLRKAYDLKPGDTAVKLALGRAYFNVRRYADAAKLLGGIDASGVPDNQQKVAFYTIRGNSRKETGDDAGALQDFEQLAKLLPADAKTQYVYGTLAVRADRMDAGLAALEKALRLDPRDARIKEAYVNAQIKRGRMTRDRNAKREAYSKAANEAKELVAVDPSYDNLILKISAELGAARFNDAVQTGKAAVAKNSRDWLAHFYLGQAYSSQEQYVQSEAPLRQALALTNDPNNQRRIWEQLGFVYEKQKDYAKAIESYQQSGNQSAVARVQQNKETAEYNQAVEAENDRIQRMREEAEKLEEELKKLEGGGGAGSGSL